MMEAELETNGESTFQKLRRRRRKEQQIQRQVNDSLNQSSTLQLYETERDTERQCRICLDHSHSSENMLVAPCRCTGTVKYVHDKCFRQWIEKQYSLKNKKEQSEFLKQGVQCQLCKFKFRLIYSFRNIFCEAQYFYSKYNEQTCIFYLFLFFFLVNFGSLAYVIFNLANHEIDFKNRIAISLILLIALLFLIATAIFTSYYFFLDFIVKTVWVFEGYEEKRLQPQSNRNKVVPLEAYN